MAELVDETEVETNPREFGGEVEATSRNGIVNKTGGHESIDRHTSIFNVWGHEQILELLMRLWIHIQMLQKY